MLESFLELVKKPVDVYQLLDALDFDDEELDKALREQPKLYMQAVNYRIQIMRERIRREMELNGVAAELALRLREKKAKAARGQGMTEAAIKERVGLNPTVQALTKKVLRLQSAEEWAKQLLEAYKQRLSAAKAIGDLHGAELAMGQRRVLIEDERAGVRKLRDNLSRKFPKGKKES